MTLYLIYTDFMTQIRSSSGLFLCSWLTCAIAMACLWPKSGKQEWATQGPSFHTARCRPDLGRQNVAMWVVWHATLAILRNMLLWNMLWYL